MSNEVLDERVVKISFDNKKFEKNVKKSMSTIDKLKNKLGFKNVANEMNDSLGTVNTSPLENGISKVSLKMSMLQHLSFNFLDQFSKKIIYVGEKLIKSLSVDNIAAGWQKFADKTTSVSTLMAQDIKIGDTLVDAESKLETVTEQLEKLNFFTDETSYNFTDMVSNIGKFTAAGQSLDEAMEAMMGIATWAALSGQNATVASNAMYQLAQAMSVGVVRKEDYKSIQNANMDTREFKQQALEAAEAAGYLIQQIDGTYQTTSKAAKAGMTVNLDNFASTLTEGGWLTSEVLMKTLRNYSNVFDEIYGMVNGYTDAEGVFHEGEYETASEAIEAYKKQLEELKVKIEECTDAEEKERLQTEYDTKMFGIKAFEAAQQARTFNDALNSVKDAVSTNWMNTFEHIFGNQEEAVKLWTKLANKLWDIFAAGGENRIDLFSAWHDAGGRDALFGDEGALWNILDAIESINNAIKEAFHNVFPITKDTLLSFGEGLKNVTKALKPTEDQLKTFVKILTGALKVVRNIVKFIKAVIKGLDPLFRVIKGSIETIFKGFKKIFDKFEKYRSSKITEQIGKKADFFVKVTNTISKALEKFIDFFSPYVRRIKELVNNLIDSIDFKQLEKFWDFIEPIINTIWKFMTNVVRKVLDFLLDIPNQLNSFVNSIKNSGFVNFLKDTWNAVIGLFFKSNEDVSKTTKNIKARSKELSDTIKETGNAIVSKTDAFRKKLGEVIEPFKPLITSLKLVFDGLLSILQAFVPIISTLFTYLGAGLKALGDGLNEFFSKDPDLSIFDKIKDFIQKNFVGIITAAIGVLVVKNIPRLIFFFQSMLKTLTMGLFEVLDSFSGVLDKAAFKLMASGIKDIAISIGIICLSLIALTAVDYGKLWQVTAVIGTLLAVIGVISVALIKMVKVGNSISSSVKKFASIKDGIFGTINNLFNSEGIGKALQIQAVGSTIKDIAEAIAVLAGSIAALTLLDPEKVHDSLKTIVILMAVLTGMSGILNLTAKSGKVTRPKGATSMAIVLFLLATQLKKIGEIPEDKLNRAIGVIAVIGGILTAMIVLNNLTKKVAKAETGKSISAKLVLNINSEALGLAALALTLSKLATIPENNLWTAVGVIASIAGVVLVLTGAIALINKFLGSSKKVIKKDKNGSSEITENVVNTVKDIKKIIASIIALVSATIILSQIAKYDATSLGIAISVIGILGAMLAGLIAIQAWANKSKSSKNSSKIVDLSSIVKALAILATCVIVLGFMPWQKLLAGGIAIIVLAGVVTGLAFLNKALFKPKDKSIVPMTNIITALVTLALATVALGLMPLDKLIAGVGAIAALAAVVTGLAFFYKLIVGVNKIDIKPLLAIAGSMLILVGTMTILSKIPLDKLWNVVAGLAIVMTTMVIMVGISKLLSKIDLNAIAAIGVIATSMLILGTALKVLSSISWEGLGLAIVAIVSMLGIILILAYALTPIAAPLLTIAGSILMISAAIMMLGAAAGLLAKYIQPLTKAIKESLPDIMDNIIIFFELLPDVLLAGLRAIGTTLIESIPIVGEFVLNFLLALVDFVINDLGPIINAIFDLALNIFVALGKAFKDNMPKVINALFDVGKYIMQGLWNGIVEFLCEILKNIPVVGNDICNALRDTLQIHSPSRITYEMGMYLDKGLANGIKDYTGYVTDNTEDFGNEVKNSMSMAISKIADTINNGLPNDVLTIRPVMDLSEIQNGTNQLYGMIKNIDGYTISGTANVANNIARDMNRNNVSSTNTVQKTNTNDQSDAGYGVINNTFNITGENPDEIANKVSEIMQLQIDRRKAAWAK